MTKYYGYDVVDVSEDDYDVVEGYDIVDIPESDVAPRETSEEVEKPGVFETVGKGLTHGVIGLGESVGAGTQWLGNRVRSETIAGAGETASEYWGEKAKGFEPSKNIQGKNVWDNPELLKSGEYWLYNVSDMVPTLAASVIPGIGAAKGLQLAKVAPKLARLGGATVGGVTGGSLEGSQTYKAVLEKGGSEEEAARAGELMTVGSSVLNAIGTGKVLNAAGSGFKNRVVKTLGAGAWEGITEGAEEPTEVFSKYFGKYLADEPLPKDLKGPLIQSTKEALTVAPIAAITGGGAGVVSGGGAVQSAQERVKNRTLTKAKKANADLAGVKVSEEINPQEIAEELYSLYKEGVPNESIAQELKGQPDIEKAYFDILKRREQPEEKPAEKQPDQEWQETEQKVSDQKKQREIKALGQRLESLYRKPSKTDKDVERIKNFEQRLSAYGITPPATDQQTRLQNQEKMHQGEALAEQDKARREQFKGKQEGIEQKRKQLDKAIKVEDDWRQDEQKIIKQREARNLKSKITRLESKKNPTEKDKKTLRRLESRLARLQPKDLVETARKRNQAEIDKEKQPYIDKRVQKLGSVEAVGEFYKDDSDIAQYAKQRARELFGKGQEAEKTWENAPAEREGDWYGTKVQITGKKKTEYSGPATVTRVLNNGNLIEAIPEGGDTAFRFDNNQVKVTDLKEAAPQEQKETKEPEAKAPPTKKDPWEIAKDIARKGTDPQASYGMYVQVMGLKPEMNAKEWRKIYDSVFPEVGAEQPAETQAETEQAGQEARADKEPWAMTRGFHRLLAQPDNVSPKERYRVDAYGKPEFYNTIESAQKALDKEHKQQVKQALFDGKPVPKEVLKEYPGLQEQEAAQPETYYPDDLIKYTTTPGHPDARMLEARVIERMDNGDYKVRAIDTGSTQFVKPEQVTELVRGGRKRTQAEKATAESGSRQRKTEYVDWFVNYTEQPNTGRTTEVKRFDKLKDAKQFSRGKHGYITKTTDGGSDFKAEDKGKTSLVETFGGFEPSAQEMQNIERLTGEKVTAEDINLKEGKEKTTVTADVPKTEIDDLTPAEQKEYLLKEVDEAINAVAKKNELDAEGVDLWEKGKIMPTSEPYLFKVPGDGEFEIVAKYLPDFKKRIEKSFPKSIVDKKFKPITEGEKEGRSQKASAARRYKKIAKEPSKIKPEDVRGLIQEAVEKDKQIGIVDADESNFENWLLSQDITQGVRDEIKSIVVERAEPKPGKKGTEQEIDDFGEKIGGARKDIAPSVSKELSDEEIASQPLAKIWPKKEVDQIEDPFLAAVAHVSRSKIPSKPRAANKVRRWVSEVKTMRNAMDMVKNMKREDFLGELREEPSLRTMADKIELLETIDRSQWDRIGFVNSKDDNVVAQVDGRVKTYKDYNEIKKAIEETEAPSKSKSTSMKFEVRGGKGDYNINKKGDPLYRSLKSFTSTREAFDYINNNHDDLVNEWEKVKERDNVKKSDVRGEENKPRTGKDRREGEDVTPETFQDAFGFRGVEFGKWVSQGKGARDRQGMLNAAFDAFHDLADILNIPAKAISLNGTLGLGFGSRGYGAAAAHYESDKVVINLTKTQGSGSLAHEWFHSLDNYFQKKRGGGHTRETSFITYNPETHYRHKNGHTLSASRYNRLNKQGGIRNASEWKRVEGVRPEVEEKFANLVHTLDKSPMRKRASMADKGKADGYWGRILERAARAFENYAITKMSQEGYDNDYLANVVPEGAFRRNKENYPYLKKEEVAPVEKAFDELFDTIETEGTDQGVALYSIEEPRRDTTPAKTLSKSELMSLFKGQKKTINDDGSLSIRFRNGKGVKVEQVEKIDENVRKMLIQAGQMSEQGVIQGKFQNGTITLIDGVSDYSTLAHENYHLLKYLKMITSGEDLVLTAQAKRLLRKGTIKDRGAEENRANALGHIIKNRKDFRDSSKLNALIQKVVDFFDGLMHIGRNSARKLAREVESERIYERESTEDTVESLMFAIEDEQIVDPDLAQKGEQEVERILNRLKKHTKKTEAKVSEPKTRGLITDYLNLKEESRNREKNLEERIKEYKKFLMGMPLSVRGKAFKGFTKLAKAKKPATREKYFEEARMQAEKYLNEHFKREAVRKLNSLRKRPKTTKGGEIKKSSLGPETQQYLDFINKVFKDNIKTFEERDAHVASLEFRINNLNDKASENPTDSNLDRLNKAETELEVTRLFGGVKDMSLDQVEYATSKLQEIIETGRTAWKAAETERKSVLKENQNTIIKEVTGEEKPVKESISEKKAREEKEQEHFRKVIRGISNFDTIHQSWRFLVDKISTKSGSKSLQSKTVEICGGAVHGATNQEEEYNKEMLLMLKEKISELSGEKKKRGIYKWIQKQSNKKSEYTINPQEYTGEVDENNRAILKEKGPEKIDLAPLEAVYWWSVNRRGEAMSPDGQRKFNARLRKMGLTNKFIKDVEKTVDPEVIDLVKWMSDTYGERIWEFTNPVYEARFGAKLTHTPQYTPIVADYRKGKTDENLLQQTDQYASMNKGPLHELTDTKMSIRPMNLLEAWADHTYDMSHFAAWALPVREMEGIFSNPDVRGAIEKEYGRKMVKSIDDFMDLFKRGQKRRKEILDWMAKWRGKFATAVLAMNPTIFYKQLASIGAMADRIPTTEFSKGVGNFFTNPVANAKILNDSTAFQTRKHSGHTRDVVKASRQTLGKSIAGIKSLPDQLMFMVRLGDQSAIYVGGWPVYKYYNNQYLEKGMSKEKAHKEAILRFEETFQDTQQSGQIMDLSLVQQGSAFQQWFTMFMTAPTSYYRGISTAIRKMPYHPADSMKRLFIYWGLMPALFEAISSAPLAFGDDDDQELFFKRVGRGMALGPVDGLFLMRDAATLIYNKMFVNEEVWMSKDITPMTDVMAEAGKFAQDIKKGVVDGEWDMERLFEDSLQISSYATGYPLEGTKDLAEGIKEGVENKNIPRVMGYSEYYTGE